MMSTELTKTFLRTEHIINRFYLDSGKDMQTKNESDLSLALVLFILFILYLFVTLFLVYIIDFKTKRDRKIN